MTKQDVLTFNQCREILHIGRNLMLFLLHNGDIPAFRVGNQWRILASDLYDFIENQRDN